jgi:hypothetical protein
MPKNNDQDSEDNRQREIEAANQRQREIENREHVRAHQIDPKSRIKDDVEAPEEDE